MGEQSQAPLRVAVIGVGHLGRHHARILAGLDGVELTAVVDADPARADEVATAFHTWNCREQSQLEGKVDAAVVAVHTEAHAEVALPLLRSGIHTLIEKPIASTLEEADALLAAAAGSGAMLAVGHSERFNPAVIAALPLITTPGFVEVHRLGTNSGRSLDIDVVFDLMIHDLDVLLATVGGDVTHIEAVGVPVLTNRVDIANARLKFTNGCIANLTASRISREPVRKVRFFQPHSYVSIDYASKELEVWRLKLGEGGAAIDGGKMEVPQEEPLKLELQDFVQAVRSKQAPRVTGHDGRRALELAQRITDCIKAGRQVGG
jgi:predicted dehydrogenase